MRTSLRQDDRTRAGKTVRGRKIEGEVGGGKPHYIPTYESKERKQQDKICMIEMIEGKNE